MLLVRHRGCSVGGRRHESRLSSGAGERRRGNHRPLAIALALAIGGLYALFSVVLGFQLNGTVNTLRRVAFLSAIYAMLALALNLQWGYAGLFNLGAAGFMAIGVYTMGILTAPVTASPSGFGLPLPVAIVGAILVTGIIGGLAAFLRSDLEPILLRVTVAFSNRPRHSPCAGVRNTRMPALHSDVVRPGFFLSHRTRYACYFTQTRPQQPQRQML